MMDPSRERFGKIAGEDQRLWQGPSVHPNPEFYKCRFQVYTPDLLWEGREFFEKAPRLRSADFMALLQKYRDEKRSCFIYVSQMPRLRNTPCDRNSEKWRDVEFAPA